MENIRYKKGTQTRMKILETAKGLFFENGYKNVSVVDISREIGIANGNLTYYFKKKSDIARTIVLDIMETCGERANELLSGEATPLERMCLSSYLYMISACADPRIGHFLSDIYADVESRSLVSVFVEYYYNLYSVLPTNLTSLSDKQIHALITADAHAKSGLLQDLLQSTNYAPTLEQTLELAETGFLVTCRLCYVDDKEAMDAISVTLDILKEYEFNPVITI